MHFLILSLIIFILHVSVSAAAKKDMSQIVMFSVEIIQYILPDSYLIMGTSPVIGKVLREQICREE